MNNNLFSINVHDNIVSIDTQKAVGEYLENQTWHMQWMPMPALPKKLNRFKPKNGLAGPLASWPIVQSTTFARCCLAIDEQHLREKHSPIWHLWREINAGLNNEYEITGHPEDMFDEEYSKEYGLDGWGWRVYVNGLYAKITSGTWGPHRDTPDLNDETSVTILYFYNLEWYPRWSGEIIFYPEDPDGVTGDYQQYNQGEHQQQRNYNVGWPDQGKIVSPVPNRVVVFDGRCLHNCHVPAIPDGVRSKPLCRVVFRARKIRS